MNYTIIHHELKKKLKLTDTDYCLCNSVYHLSRNNPCDAGNQYFADKFGCTPRTIINSKNRLIDRGLIRVVSGGIETTDKWYKGFEIFDETPTRDKKRIEENSKFVKEVWEYFLLRTKRRFLLNSSVRTIIERLKDEPIHDIRKAIDNFVNDDWEGRKNNMDIVYCLGIRNQKDNYVKWRDVKPKNTMTML